MKKTLMTILAAAMLLGTLAACGGKQPAADGKDVDLTAFYSDLATEYEWTDTDMTDLTDDLLDNYYPGLRDLTAKQQLLKLPMMSSVVNEMALLEYENKEDADAAAAILQDRIDTQAQGGAWYPESMDAWGKGAVIQQGNYVAMIASAEHQDEIAEKFNALFA